MPSDAGVNVLWILTTQWRAQAFGYAGDRNACTPALDRFAEGAFNFAQAVTPHPFGPFARAALLTGVESPQNGIRDYFDPLPAAARTVAHEFASRGFETGFFGKWHLGRRSRNAPLVGEEHARTRVPPEGRGGFGFWEGFESGFQLMNPWLHGTRLPEPRQFSGYQSDILCERAGDWCRERGGASWFCVVSLEPPHPPYQNLPAGFSRPRGPIELRDNVPADPAVRLRAEAELAGYYGQIAATDHALGGLLSRIDRANTMVVFTSVHGDMHGSHGLFRKGWPQEESVRIPLLIQAPGLSPARSDDAVSLTELSALTLAWVDRGEVRRPGTGPARISMPSVVTLPDQCDRVWSGLRSPRRKYVQEADGTPWLFFDLENDPLEMRNLIDDPEWTAELSAWREAVDNGGGR